MSMPLKVTIDGKTDATRREAEKAADDEIAAFNNWYLNKFTAQQPLTNYEKSILKTYLVYKLEGSMGG